MLEHLFGTPIIGRVLFYLLVNEKNYASQMQQAFDLPLSSIQRACARLEQGGILACQSEGKTRIYQFIPRYPSLEELRAFLEKAYACLPPDYKQRSDEPLKQARPRRQGKHLRGVGERSRAFDAFR
jgi:hypothetical protein